ncbi:HAD family hydrolase [Tundrisphaera sp. TA3]|uniref:HAD family hydrolase n=1 Tax=Tundrisphaera sp. TA3 TaxID=3435775 RepID=UPI003EBD31BD
MNPTIRALATDYDGTLADRGVIDATTWFALGRWRASGRAVVLVTGRELPELLAICPEIAGFDRVVAENGAVLYRPGDGSERRLAPPPPDGFVSTLRARGVGPISVGRAIVATWQPHAEAVEAVIREQGLDLAVTLNKRAVMVLPSGVDKASGLAVALAELGLTPGEAAGVGDAENDLAFLRICGRSVAVANALPEVKSRVDVVTQGERGAGVAEWIDAVLSGQG